MPFTFAHPIYIAPLKALKPAYVSMTGLVLGAMAPDLEYFIALEPHQWIGHSAAGLFFEAIPLSILLAYWFHHVVKLALSRHLPSWWDLDQRAYMLASGPRWGLRSFKDWAVFIGSVIVGFYSHIGLDAFTHVSGAMVTQLPWLKATVAGGVPVYKLLQHGLSLLGMLLELLVLLYFLRRSGRVAAPDQGNGATQGAYIRPSVRGKLLYWGIACAIMCVTLALKLLLSTSGNWIGAVVVAPISGLALGITAASLLSRSGPFER
ncbi:DUF4184 family protein [Paenibacillus marinisediminis]